MSDLNPYRYATVDDLVRRFGPTEIIQLTDDAAVAVDEERCADALEDAASEMDVYLAGRYTLPLATVPRLLVNICCDLARAILMRDLVTETVTNKQRDARDLLKALRDGKATLGLDLAQQPVATSDGPAATGAARVFTGDTLNDYANPGQYGPTGSCF